MQKVLLFSTKSYSYLLNDPGRNHGLPLGAFERRDFPDGETYLRIVDQVVGHHVVLIGGTVSDSDTIETLELGTEFVKSGCKRLSILIPYLGYSTMERISKKGEIARLKYRTKILSLIPAAPEGTTIFLVEPHSDCIPYYFENNLNVTSLNLHDFFVNQIQSSIGVTKDLVLGSVDFGRAKYVNELAKYLSVRAIFCGKARKSATEVETFLEGYEVRNKNVLLVDDMIRTGASLESAASLLIKQGARQVDAMIIHAPLTVEKSQEVDPLPSIKKLIVSNSHPNSTRKWRKEMEVISILPNLLNEICGDKLVP